MSIVLTISGQYSYSRNVLNMEWGIKENRIAVVALLKRKKNPTGPHF